VPRFFFHYRTPSLQTTDGEGIVLPDAEAAWYQAVRSARDIITAELVTGCVAPGSCVEIADECGLPIDAIRFEEIAAVG
jgi:hypothetical protein